MKIDLSTYTPRQEEIHVDEWTKEPLFVRELTGSQLEILQRYSRVEDGKVIIEHQNALLCICSLVDAEGNYVFTENDIKYLENQPAYRLSKVIAVVGKLSNVNL